MKSLRRSPAAAVLINATAANTIVTERADRTGRWEQNVHMDLHEDIQNKSEVIPIKTKEELTALKEEVKALNRKLHELTEEELEQVTGCGVMLLTPFSP